MKMLIPAIALLSSTVMAADLKFNVEGRFDYASSTVKHELVTATNNYEEKRMEGYSNIIRLNAVYTVNENLSGRIRYRLSTDQSTKNRDLSFTNVDFFYVDHKTEFFTARLGKQSLADSLGREFYVAGTDYPTTSFVNSSTSLSQSSTGVVAPGFTTGYAASNSLVYNMVKNDADIYRVGATLMFNQIPNSTLSLAVFNPQKNPTYSDASAGSTNDNSTDKKLGYGVFYNGNFMEKMLQPTLGYSSFGIAGEKNAATPANDVADATQKLMSVGVRSELQGLVVDLDWKQYKRANTTRTALAIDNSDKSTSIWANVAYTWDNLTPFVNFISDKYNQTASDVNDFKRTALSAGLMIKPFKDTNFRYHVAYTSDVKKIDGATLGTADNKIKASQISAGIKFDI